MLGLPWKREERNEMRKIAVAIILAGAAWLTTAPAQAHVLAVGEERPAFHLCNAEAAYALAAIAREQGARFTNLPSVQYTRGRECRIVDGDNPASMIRVMEVAPVINTPDGYALYLYRVEFLVVLRGEARAVGGPWFAFHKHKVEGEVI